MGIVRDLYYARKMSAGLKLPAPTVALLIKRLRLAAAMGGDVTKTVSGTMVHITDALAKAALSVLVNITPIQPGSGDPSPSNVRPISGLTGLSVYRRSANLLNTATNITGKYITSNGSISNGDDAQYSDLIPVTVGERYTWSLVSNRTSGGNNRWHGYDSAGNWIQQIKSSGTGQGIGLPFLLSATIPNGISYVRLSYGINDTDAMFEEGDTATDYQPYGYDEYPCDWTTQAGTVYGGTVDVVTGVLAITHKGFVFDGTENLTAAGYGGITAVYKFATDADKIVYTDSPQTKKSDYKCSHYKWSGYMYAPSFSDVRVGTGANAASNERLTFMNALIGRTLTQFKQYLTDQYNAGTPVTVYAPLATPLTYQLTPQEVQMLLGENYVWSSYGDTVSVTYYAEGNANTLQSLNILLGGNYSNPKTADDVSDKEALEIILGGNK